jgi:hypothetical protein
MKNNVRLASGGQPAAPQLEKVANLSYAPSHTILEFKIRHGDTLKPSRLQPYSTESAWLGTLVRPLDYAMSEGCMSHETRRWFLWQNTFVQHCSCRSGRSPRPPVSCVQPLDMVTKTALEDVHSPVSMLCTKICLFPCEIIVGFRIF